MFKNRNKPSYSYGKSCRINPKPAGTETVSAGTPKYMQISLKTVNNFAPQTSSTAVPSTTNKDPKAKEFGFFKQKSLNERISDRIGKRKGPANGIITKGQITTSAKTNEKMNL